MITDATPFDPTTLARAMKECEKILIDACGRMASYNGACDRLSLAENMAEVRRMAAMQKLLGDQGETFALRVREMQAFLRDQLKTLAEQRRQQAAGDDNG